MRHLAFAFVALSLVATPSLAAPCKDARGKFVKCPQAVKGKDGRCRLSSGPNKGKFTKC